MGRWTGTDGQHLATNFRPFLKFLGRRDLTDALKMASLAKRHGIVPMSSCGLAVAALLEGEAV